MPAYALSWLFMLLNILRLKLPCKDHYGTQSIFYIISFSSVMGEEGEWLQGRYISPEVAFHFGWKATTFSSKEERSGKRPKRNLYVETCEQTINLMSKKFSLHPVCDWRRNTWKVENLGISETHLEVWEETIWLQHKQLYLHILIRYQARTKSLC